MNDTQPSTNPYDSSITNLYYSDMYTAAAYAFDTTRKARWIADSLKIQPIANVRVVEPESLSQAQLQDVHDPRYVTAVMTGTPCRLAESSGFPWDPSVWDAVRASNGGAVAAALHALSTGGHAGSLSSGLHHARRRSGAAFCTFNGLALAARAAVDAGARRVLILDLDAHIGDGTLDMLRGWTRVAQVDLTTCSWGAPANDAPFISCDAITCADDYLPTLERRLAKVDTSMFDLCIYNAGMDPHEDCDLGGLEGLTTEVLRERERIVFDWAVSANVPVAFVLAGGYAGGLLDRDTLVDLHRMTIAAAAAANRMGGAR